MSDRPIYIAAPWLDLEQMPARAKQFEDAGYRITHKWWIYEGGEQSEKTHQFLHDCALHDFHGVVDSKAVVVFNTAKSEGKATEQGIALALNIPVIVINGPIKVTMNIFHHLGLFKLVNSIEEALEQLQKYV